jgi:hypothetical protein
MNWSATVTCFMFAMPTLFWFLCDSAMSMCFLLLSCFGFFCRCTLLMLCDRGFLCTLFPCMVQQQFGHFRACQRQINWLQAYFTSFKFVCGSMRRRGLLDSPSNLCAGPWGVGVSATLFQSHVRIHGVSGFPRPAIKFIFRPMRFQGHLGPRQIYVQVHEISGSPGTSFKLICGPMRF